MRYRLLFGTICLIFIESAACNSTSSDRFGSQKESFVFSSTSSTLAAYGASRVESYADAGFNFRCPAVSGMSSESGITVFNARANSSFPAFDLKTIAGIRGSDPGGFGVSMIDMPIGLLDVYQRCGASRREKWTTFCPPDYAVVDDCGAVGEGENACALVYEGLYKLVVSAKVSDDPGCMSEEADRTPYSVQSTPYMAYACDAFSPIEIPAAYRGDSPNGDCCSINDRGTLDFCLKPCGCRDLTVRLVRKADFEQDSDAPEKPAPDAGDDELRIAVFSNVENNDDAFEKMLGSIKDAGVDVVVSLGNLTSDGSADSFAKKREMIDYAFTQFDGINLQSGCRLEEGMICCPNAGGRLFSGTCNAILDKASFIAGLGENEYDGDVSAFNELFGPSYSSSVIGKVQLVMLDTAEASMPDIQKSWLKEALKTPEPAKCSIPSPTDGPQWPTLAECHAKMPSSRNVTCRDCIGREAYCVPPGKDRSDAALGPENCICVPASSKICRHGMICKEMNGSESECACTRDEDCGKGGTCRDGECRPPLRLVFSYTPLFDEFGSRSNSFVSKTEAASLLSLLGKANTAAVFSGRIRDYASFSKAGVKMYVTGGGGGDMVSFARKGHHWLRVTISNAYTGPEAKDVSVEVIEF